METFNAVDTPGVIMLLLYFQMELQLVIDGNCAAVTVNSFLWVAVPGALPLLRSTLVLKSRLARYGNSQVGEVCSDITEKVCLPSKTSCLEHVELADSWGCGR